MDINAADVLRAFAIANNECDFAGLVTRAIEGNENAAAQVSLVIEVVGLDPTSHPEHTLRVIRRATAQTERSLTFVTVRGDYLATHGKGVFVRMGSKLFRIVYLEAEELATRVSAHLLPVTESEILDGSWEKKDYTSEVVKKIDRTKPYSIARIVLS